MCHVLVGPFVSEPVSREEAKSLTSPGTFSCPAFDPSEEPKVFIWKYHVNDSVN